MFMFFFFLIIIIIFFFLFLFYFFISFNASTSFSSKFMDIVLLTDLHASLLFCVSSLVRWFDCSMFPSPFVDGFFGALSMMLTLLLHWKQSSQLQPNGEAHLYAKGVQWPFIYSITTWNIQSLIWVKAKFKQKLSHRRFVSIFVLFAISFPFIFFLPFFFRLRSLPLFAVICNTLSETNVCKFLHFPFEIAESSATKSDPLTCWTVERPSNSV